jgi:hypothetical protein
VISAIDQMEYRYSPGYEEVKEAQPTCDKADLCSDLVRVSCFVKNHFVIIN